jgi:hypothetical protein
MTTLNESGFHKTKDYELFKFREDNRQINKSHVKKLVESLKIDNDLHLHPIVVNEKMEVIDGQHRLTAAKALDLEVTYVIDKNFDPSKLITLNTTQKRWSTDDYLNYWLIHGSNDYLLLGDFIKDFGFTLVITLIWITNTTSNQIMDYFKKGCFKFKIDPLILEAMLTSKALINIMIQTNYKVQKLYNQNCFHKALKSFLTNPVVIHERFLDRFEKSPYKISFTTSMKEYVIQFVDIYNYDMRKEKIKLVMDGDRIDLK